MSEEKLNKTIVIGIRVTSDFKEKLDKIAKEHGNKTVEFCRNAIMEKVRGIEYPELYNASQNTENLLRLEQKITAQTETINLLRRMIEINQTLLMDKKSFPKSEIDLEEQTNLILEVFKNHRKSLTYLANKTPLKINQIAEQTKLETDLIYEILTTRDDLFKETDEGWDLND
ncbi:MAG: hypothetical protein ACFFDN_38845 [Candidatus Hodarchaeota archaeon]